MSYIPFNGTEFEGHTVYINPKYVTAVDTYGRFTRIYFNASDASRNLSFISVFNPIDDVLAALKNNP